MRVVTGTAKGRKLYTLPGQETRPTSDFVKQAVFNMIQDDLEGRRVLDLFAGSGQMGIEALSRGAVWADFVDDSRAAAEIVEKNLAHCGLGGRARVHVCGALAFLGRAADPYDVIFLDPPYHAALLDAAVKEIIRIDLLRIGGIIVCESAAPMPEYPGYKLCGGRVYGRKAITLFTKPEGID